MRRRNFSISALMGIVLFIAVGLAALRSGSRLWASVVFTLVVWSLLVATVASILRSRPALIGFVVFAWGYLLMGQATETLPVSLKSQLIREAYIVQQGNRYAGPDTRLPRTGSMQIVSEVRGGRYVVSADSVSFHQIASALLCVVFGLVGALVGRLIGSRDDPPSPG